MQKIQDVSKNMPACHFITEKMIKGKPAPWLTADI